MKTWFTKEFLKASAVLLIVFVAGAGTGYIGGRQYAEYKFLKERESLRGARSPLSPRQKRQKRRARNERRFMRRLERDLNLNPAQRANVDRALQRHYERIRDIRSRMSPQLNSIMQEIRKDVRSFLDNEQKTSFDRMVEKFEERRKRRWRKGRKHHPGDPAGQSKKQ